ncbi:MAG: class I SAM-dependent methyltransferase [Vicinamibacterales bacterium]
MAETLEATLRRLKEERDEADRRYNDALTALDKTFRGPSPLAAIPPGYDDHQLTPLNESWNILPAAPAFGGPAGRLKTFIWRIVAPFLQRQLTFNSQLVDHLNRNATAGRVSQRALDETIAVLNRTAAVQAEFHSQLLLFLQQITAYVDTKDRDHASSDLVLNAALSAMGDSFLKRWESLMTRAERLSAEQVELRATVAIAHQAALTMKRELGERVQQVQGVQRGHQVHRVQQSEVHGALDAYKYVGFENQFRGSRETIRQRLEGYVPFFEGASNVLDVGCGRGELLDLLRSRGIKAQGIDLNHEMVEECRARGLDVTEADAVTHLSSLPDASLGGVIAVQVVEHLEPDYLLRFLELAFHKVQNGGRIILETLNPACWVAFFESYIRDITHRWPLHPETLKYFVLASGFTAASIEWRSPVAKQQRLQTLPLTAPDALPPELVEAFNANVEKLNARMFTHMDYAIVGVKGAG